MNFGANIRPNFSVPPPPISPVNSGITGIGSRANLTNEFRHFNGPMHNHNQPFSPYNRMMSPPMVQVQGQINYGNVSGNFSHNNRGRGFRQFSPNNGNGRGYNTPPPIQSPHSQEQISYGSDDMFGAVNVISNVTHSFPHSNPTNPHQQKMYEKVRPQNQSLAGQIGRGFHSAGRGRRGSGGHGNSSNNSNNSNQRNGRPAKKKKERIDKRELPENNVFFCDICDRGFKTEEKHKEHVDDHQKCSFKDCPFVAAPKLVQLHMTMQHRGGLAKKIWSVESEEDIKKWREERKRNYPTNENVEKKKELQAERMKRGQVLETKDFSKMKRGRGGRRGQGRGRRRYNQGQWRKHGRGDDDEAQENSDDDGDDDDGPPLEMKIVKSTCQDEQDHADKAKEDQDIKADVANPIAQTESSERQNEEKNASSLSLLAGYGSATSDEDSSDEEASLSISHQSNGSSPQASLKENDKMLNSTDGKDKAATLFQPFSLDNGSQSPLSTTIQEQSPPAHGVTSPECCDESPTNSPTAYDKDPFNLTDMDSTRPDTFQGNSQNAESELTGVSQVDSLTEADKGNQDQILKCPSHPTVESSVDLSTLNSGCEDYLVNLPIDDSEIISEMDDSLGKSLSCDKLAKESFDSTERQDKRRGTKRKHSRPSPDDHRMNRNSRRGDFNNKTRRFNYKPQAKSYTLLEKLLAPQIRQERNKILQCVYFIVEQKFFDEEQTPSKA